MKDIDLAKFDCSPPQHLDKKHIKAETEQLKLKLEDLQHRLYAEHKHSILIVLQGMDASGKDGAIKQVFTAVNPMGCRVYPFRKPTEKEMDRDFLWRLHKVVPPKGMIHIFNRSYYEEVLIQRVHKWVKPQQIKQRYQHINAFERLLVEENNTTIIKFFLHVSQEEQIERLEERLVSKRKMWKYNAADMQEREFWTDYMKAYEDVFENCGPEQPWVVVPSNKNWYKEYIVAKTIVDRLEPLNFQYPDLNGD